MSKYEGPYCYQSKDIANVKIFADKQTNKQNAVKRTGDKLTEPCEKRKKTLMPPKHPSFEKHDPDI